MPETIQVPIDISDQETGALPFAQNMWVNHDEYHFFLHFYQVIPPLVTADVPDSVKARRVAAFAIPAERLPAVIRALKTIASTYEESTGRKLNWDSEEGA